MNVSYGRDDIRKRHYVPPAMGNGKISFQVDPEGCMKQKTYCGMQPVIVRSGFRYDDEQARLIHFGYFDQHIADAGEPVNWKQVLDTENATCECICEYSSGLAVTTRIFCHVSRDIIVIRKNFSGVPEAPEFHFRYTFPEDGHLRTAYAGKGSISFQMGKRTGMVFLHSMQLQEQGSSDSVLAFSGRAWEVELLLSFDEEAEGNENRDSLFCSHKNIWQEYWRESRIDLPDPELMQAYMIAQYHLRISSTPWSIPTGLFPTHWDGRFFAYDEFYTHGALLTSGHFSMAAKIDRFRAGILDSAIDRTCYRALHPVSNLAARYPWETREDGSEGAPPGFWMDRYVHMANIAFSAWEFYLFTQDEEMLRETLYPMIRACAEYHRRSAVYVDSVTGPYIGKCTDMERFGEFIERPYSTTCGVIATLTAAWKSAKILGLDENLQRTWETLAEALYKALPVENDRYVPYPGCHQRSIAVYHGLYPYGVISPADPVQERAIADAEKHFEEFSGQYGKGERLSAWYAGVIATAEVRRGNYAKALELLQNAVKYSTGCFYECFEVYEKEKLPWFTTASGALIRAVNALVIQAANEHVPLWNGKPFSFTLPQPGRTVFQYDSEDNHIKQEV